MIKEDNVSGGFWWRCLDCGHISRSKTDVAKHVEAKHIESEGFSCYYCAVLERLEVPGSWVPYPGTWVPWSGSWVGYPGT